MFLVGRPPPGKWFSNLRLCGGSGLGEKKTLNTSVVWKKIPQTKNTIIVTPDNRHADLAEGP